MIAAITDSNSGFHVRLARRPRQPCGHLHRVRRLIFGILFGVAWAVCGGRGPDYARPPWKATTDALRTSMRSPRLDSALDGLFLSTGARPSPRLLAGRRGRDPWSWDLLPFFSRGPLTCAYLRVPGPSPARGGIPRGSRLSPESFRASAFRRQMSRWSRSVRIRFFLLPGSRASVAG